MYGEQISEDSMSDEQQRIDELKERFKRLKAEREAMRKADIPRERHTSLFIDPHRGKGALTSSRDEHK